MRAKRYFVSCNMPSYFLCLCQGPREQKLMNDQYDEAVEVSQSMDQAVSKGPPPSHASAKPTFGGGGAKMTEGSRSVSVTDKPFDEAFEFSQSGSEESVDTRTSDKIPAQAPRIDVMASQTQAPRQAQPAYQQAPAAQRKHQHDEDEESSSEEEEEEEGVDAEDTSYENIEGAYNPKDYAHLNVPPEVKDLFQYIERYKPHEVELDTTLKCFIPEYIPAIGEIDAFIKVPRPDGVDDELGFKVLDEPATVQSDPTVLELQLRALSKKQQYGDVVVRSIEYADKNPLAIEKWIQSIDDLHRTKPPPQVHYKKNMPDIESLMDAWPEGFETMLENLQLPSPDLDLSIAEYAKILCALLDIPTYENPIESLYLMFSLYMDFRNNPHFQAMRAGGKNDGTDNYAYGGADVMEIS